jgi:hypothetical protein
MVTYKLLEICKDILDKEEIEFLQKKIKGTIKKKIKRENFIKIIEIIRNNKYIFKSLGYLDLYNKLLKKLYCEIECLININSKFYEENYFSIHQQINSFKKLNNSIYLEDIIENIPGLEILIYHYNNCKNYYQIDLNDNILIEKYKLQKTPVFDLDYEKSNVGMISCINLLLKIFSELHWSVVLQKIMYIIIFDFIFRNFYFVKENKKFVQVIKDKIEEFNIQEEKCLIKEKSFKTILLKYYDDIHIMNKWMKILDKHISNNLK